MTITWQTPGAINDSAQNGTSVTLAYPASSSAGEKLILIIGQKPSTANGGSVTTPTNWNLVTSITGAGGYGTTLGADTGNTNLFVYERTVPEGGLSGSLVVTVATNNVCWGFMSRLTNTSSYVWDSVAGTTGSDTTSGNVSITFAADPGVTADDFILAAMCIPTDVTTPNQFSAQAFTQAGITFGTVTEVNEPDSGTGNDIGGFSCRALVTSGTSTAAPELTATAGGVTTNVRGPGVFIRIREKAVVITLTGNDCSQVNTTTTGGISFPITQDLTGNNVNQPNTSTSGSINTGNIRYWVGGTGNWDGTATANWSFDSGGAGGAPVPTISDDVIFDSNSDAGSNFTVSILFGAPRPCRNFTVMGQDKVITFNMSGSVHIAKDVNWIPVGGNIIATSFYGQFVFVGGAGVTHSINTNNVETRADIRTDGTPTTTYNFASDFNGDILYLTNGILNTNNYNLLFDGIQTETGTATANLGSSVITLTNSGLNLSAGKTINAGTSKFIFRGSAAGSSVVASTYTLYDLEFYKDSGAIYYVSDDLICNDFTVINAISGRLLFYIGSATTPISGKKTLTIGGTFSVTGSNQKFSSVFSARSAYHSDPSIISAANVNLNYANFYGISAQGAAAPFAGTMLGNRSWCSGITFTAPKTVYFRGASGTTNWTTATNVFSITSGGSGAEANFPLPQDTVIIDNNTLSTTISSGADLQIGNLNASARTTAIAINLTNPINICGDSASIKTSSSVTWNSAFAIIYIDTDCELDIATSINSPITIRANKVDPLTYGTLKLKRNFTHTSLYELLIVSGYFDLNGFTATIYALAVGESDTPIQKLRGLVFNGGTFNLTYSSSWSTYKGQYNGGFTFGSEYINVVGGTGTENVSLTLGNVAGEQSAVNLKLLGSFALYEMTGGYINNLDASGGSGTINYSLSRSFYGDIKLGTNTPTSNISNITKLIGSKNQTIDTANQNIRHPLTIEKTAGSKVTLTSNLTLTDARVFTLTSGGLDLNGKTLTGIQFVSTGTATRNLDFNSGTIDCTGTSQTWNSALTNFTITGQSTGKIKFSNAAAKSMIGANNSYPTIDLAGAGALTVSGSNTFYDFINSVQPTTVTFTASTTSTFNEFSLRGTSGNLVTVNSSSTITKAILTKSANIVDCDYLAINDTDAKGGAAWYAGSNSVDGGDNLGWIFADAPEMLSANNVNQLNISSSNAITQNHNLAGNNVNQTNTTTTGIISLVLNLTGNHVIQQNISSTGFISSATSLIANSANQSNRSTSEAIWLVLNLTGNHVTQINSSTAGSIWKTLTLTGNNVLQLNRSSTDSITQAQLLTGNNCSQPNTTTTGVVNRVLTLTGNNANQPNTSTTGSIWKTLNLTSNSVFQTNTTTAGAIWKALNLLANNVDQPNLSATGSISIQAGALTGNDVNQPNSSTAGAIWRTLTLTGNGVYQANQSTAEAVWQIQSVLGNSVNQANRSSSASITQAHNLPGHSVQQPNLSSTGQVSLFDDLLGNNVTQVNLSSAEAISQTQLITGSNGVQPNTSTTGAVSKTVILDGNNLSQVTSSTAGAVSQTHLLIGNGCSQINRSTMGAIGQAGDLIGINAVQANQSTAGAVSQTHVVVATNCTQLNLCTSGAITKTTTLSANNATQVNRSSTGDINQALALSANACVQANTSSTGSIAQTHKLTGNAVRQPNQSSSGAIGQTGDLFGNSVTQFNRSSIGAISQHHYLTGNAAQQSNQTSAGAIEIATVLTGNSVLQLNRSETGFVEQLHILHGFNANQFNRSSNGSVVVQGRLIGANAYQTNLSSAGRIQAYRIEPSPSGPAFIRGQFTQARPVSTNRRRPVAANLNGTANQN